MKTQTFPQDAILVYLLHRATTNLRSTAAIAEGTGFSVTCVRDNIQVMLDSPGGFRHLGWIQQDEGSRPATWTLTTRGREVARVRERRER